MEELVVAQPWVFLSQAEVVEFNQNGEEVFGSGNLPFPPSPPPCPSQGATRWRRGQAACEVGFIGQRRRELAALSSLVPTSATGPVYIYRSISRLT